MGLDAGLGRANVAIRATLEKLDGDLSDAKGRIDSAVQRMARSAADNLKIIGTGAIAGIGAAAGAVAGLGAALAAVAIDAAPVQGLEQAFYGLANASGIGGDAMLEALQKGSSGMIANRDLMLSFNKAASLVSVDFAKQLPDAMQYLGKVSASTGQDVGFLMDSLVTGVGRLSPMILDNLGIQVDLASATERAAEMYGVEASALTKTQIQAGMMSVTLEKLAANTEAMPDVSQSAAASLAQLKATFQNTKDKIGMAFLPVLITVMGVISRLAEQILPPLTNFLEGTLAPAFEKVAGVVENFLWMLDVGVAPIDALKMALSTLFGPEIAETVTRIVTGIGDFIAKAQEALAPVLAWLSENVKLQDVLLALGAAIAVVVVPIIWGVISAIGTAMAVFAAVIAIVALLRLAWETNFLGIRDIAASVWGWLQTNIPIAVEAVRVAVTTAIAQIREWWETNGDGILTNAQTVWTTIQTVIGTAVSTISSVVTAVIGGVKAFWEAHGAAIMTIASAAWTYIVTVITTFADRIVAKVQAFVGLIQGFWEAHGAAIMANAQVVWDTIQMIIQTIGQNIASIIEAFSAAIKGDWEGFGQNLRDIWDRNWTAMWEAVKAFGAIIVNSVKSIVADVISFFRDTDWGAVGKGIIDGIARGISNGASTIANAASNAARAALDAAKGFLGIHSPSRLAALQIGEPFALGIGAGIGDAVPALLRAAEMAGMRLMAATERMLVTSNGALPGVSREGSGGTGSTQIIIYGLTIEGVESPEGLLAQLQAMA